MNLPRTLDIFVSSQQPAILLSKKKKKAKESKKKNNCLKPAIAEIAPSPRGVYTPNAKRFGSTGIVYFVYKDYPFQKN